MMSRWVSSLSSNDKFVLLVECVHSVVLLGVVVFIVSRMASVFRRGVISERATTTLWSRDFACLLRHSQPCLLRYSMASEA